MKISNEDFLAFTQLCYRLGEAEGSVAALETANKRLCETIRQNNNNLVTTDIKELKAKIASLASEIEVRASDSFTTITPEFVVKQLRQLLAFVNS